MAKKTHKIGKNSVLELPTRRKIYGIVRKYAGSHFREIERKSGFSTGVTKYHLDYMVRRDIIRLDKSATNNIRYFTTDLSEDDRKIMSLLRVESARKVILFLIINGKSIHKEIQEFVGLSGSTISWHLSKLFDEHVIEKKKDYYLLKIDEKEIMRLLIAYKKSFLDSLVDRVIEMWDIRN